MSGIDVLGWASAGVFTTSYFFQRPQVLRRVQMLGALMWTVYGLLLRAPPVVVANVMVLGAAILTAKRSPRGDATELVPSTAAVRPGEPATLQ
jgi:hypothetical protein